MSTKLILLLLVICFCAYPLPASTYWVGSCHAGSFPTISAAVTSPNVAAGSTINICAGGYVEQVIISKSLTLQGLSNSTQSGASILAPSSLQTTPSAIMSRYLLAPVIWVTAGTVNISNVSVTVTGAAQLTSSDTAVGFYYAGGSSGTLNHVAFSGIGQPQSSVGMWVENQFLSATSVTIENSYSAAGIFAGSLAKLPTLTVQINGNQIYQTATPSGTWGVELYSVNGTVNTNFISGPRWSGTPPVGIIAYGVLDDGLVPTNVTISGNTIQITDDWLYEFDYESWGIALAVDGATVKSNRISGAEFGVDMECHAGTVSGNTLSNVTYGISDVPSGFTGVNSFFNTPSKVSGGC